MKNPVVSNNINSFQHAVKLCILLLRILYVFLDIGYIHNIFFMFLQTNASCFGNLQLQ